MPGSYLNAAAISSSSANANVPEQINVPITMASDLLAYSYTANLAFNQPIDNGGYNLMTNDGSYSFAGGISGSGGFTSTSFADQITMTGNSTYTGATKIDGSLTLAGDLGAISGSTSITMGGVYSSLVVGDATSTVANPDRLNDSASLHLFRQFQVRAHWLQQRCHHQPEHRPDHAQRA